MASTHKPGTILEVNAGPHDRKNAVVSWACTGGSECEGSHTLRELDESGEPGRQVACQCVPGQ